MLAQMKTDTRLLLETEDSYALVEYFADTDVPQRLQLAAALAQEFYKKEKDVKCMFATSRAAISVLLTKAAQPTEGHDTQARMYRTNAKILAYNLGANTWPGWGEEGISITDDQRAAGLDAAKLNLRLAITLKRDAVPMSNAHWLLGAHLMVAGEHEGAGEEFRLSAEKAREGGQEDLALMENGYGALNNILSGNEEAEKQFEGIVSRLGEMETENAGFFAEQLETARKVLN